MKYSTSLRDVPENQRMDKISKMVESVEKENYAIQSIEVNRINQCSFFKKVSEIKAKDLVPLRFLVLITIYYN